MSLSFLKLTPLTTIPSYNVKAGYYSFSYHIKANLAKCTEYIKTHRAALFGMELHTIYIAIGLWQLSTALHIRLWRLKPCRS
jgi:hypothetical protein